MLDYLTPPHKGRSSVLPQLDLSCLNPREACFFLNGDGGVDGLGVRKEVGGERMGEEEEEGGKTGRYGK